ncbi:TIGR02466 family protein [Henriciella sp. AS95]|uniref:TIGR02466 family protein n=1 Tax=Henriciella sp. AS95 TaxID=3135782 RepID=UPI00317FA1FE
MTIRLLFPTHLSQTRYGDEAFREEAEAACWMIEDGDTAGHDWCEEKGYPGYTSYASLDDLPGRAPAFGQLAKALTKQATQFARELHWELPKKGLSLDAFWINILGEGGNHSGHIHPGSVISGTYYVSLPPGAGDIRFEDPRLAMMMAAPPLQDNAPEALSRFIYIAPQPGDVLMWESWLRHEVMASQTEEPRISISFNFGLAS